MGCDLAITYRDVVYPWQCDHIGHMNVTRYVDKFDEATLAVLFIRGAHAVLSARDLRGREEVGCALPESYHNLTATNGALSPGTQGLSDMPPRGGQQKRQQAIMFVRVV